MSERVLNRLLRLSVKLPGLRSLVQRILTRPSEVSLTEARFLGQLASAVPANRPIIEIGTLFGASTKVLALFKPRATALITVDNFRWNPLGLARTQHARITRAILGEAVLAHNVVLRAMGKREFYATYDGEAPGLVFLDASHSYESTLEDIRWAQRAGATVICGHDYAEQFPGVLRAVAECGGADEVVETIFVMRQAGV